MAEEITKRGKFAHRSNRDGTTDSICKDCFMTVAKAIWEAELERAERLHCCDEHRLGGFKPVVRQQPQASVLPWRASA
jgi:hypothetical protein